MYKITTVVLSRGESLNAFINRAIDETIDRDIKTPQQQLYVYLKYKRLCLKCCGIRVALEQVGRDNKVRADGTKERYLFVEDAVGSYRAYRAAVGFSERKPVLEDIFNINVPESIFEGVRVFVDNNDFFDLQPVDGYSRCVSWRTKNTIMKCYVAD